MAEIPVTILVEHFEGDENWTAVVPLIEGCQAEGSTPEEAAQEIIPLIKDFVHNDPERKVYLEAKPEFRLLEIRVDLEG